MAYDEKLGARVAKVLEARDDVTEKKMFGGLAFMVSGHMTVGVIKEDLMVRVGAPALEDALSREHCRPMNFTGRVSKNMVYVAPGGTKAMRSLRAWVQRGLAYTDSLPAKGDGARKKKGATKKKSAKKGATKKTEEGRH